MPNFVGGTGNDTFTLNIGDGASTLIDAGGADIVKFGPGINTSMVTYARAGNDLVIKYGATDTLRISDHFATDSNGNATASRIETLQYTGGFTVNLSTVPLKMSGTTGADTLLGWVGNDQILGDAGNDTLSGFDGNDILSSAGNDDVVYGGNGNDLVYGGGGIDLLNGDAGNDTIFGDGGNDTINGGDGNDTIDGGINNDIMTGGAGDDTYVVDTMADQVIENAGEGIDLVQTGLNYTLGATLESLTLTGLANVDGTGNSSNNVLNGNAGNNVLNGISGADTLSGGAGNDTLVFTAGAANSGVLNGNAGADALVLNLTSDQVTQALRADMQGFSDWMASNLAAAGGDAAALAAQNTGTSFTFASINLTVSTLETINIFVDGQPVPLADFLNTAPTITTTAMTGDEDQAITGVIAATDAQGDTLSFAVQTGPANGTLTVDANTGSYSYQGAADWNGADQFTVAVSDGRGGITTQAIAVNIAAVNDAPTTSAATASGNEDQVITGTVQATDVDGDALNFAVATGPANGTLTVDADTGAYSYQGVANWSGSDQFTVAVSDGNGASAMQTVAVNVAAVADAPTLTVAITNRTDVARNIAGTKNADIIVGGSGADTISGGNGDDVISGDPEDIYVMNLAITGALVDTDGSEQLSFAIANLPSDAVLSAGHKNADGSWSLATADLAGLTLTLTDALPFQMTVSALSTEGSNASSASTSIVIDPSIGLGETAYGNKGADIINAGNGNDLVYGNSGNDVIHGDTGNDSLYGGTGNDQIFGDNGNDTLYGGKGNDALDGGSGNDILHGNTGNDVVDGGLGDDIVWGDEGNDTLSDGSGSDQVVAGTGDDQVIAGSGNDTYNGTTGFDTLDFSQASAGVSINVAAGLASGGAGTDLFANFDSYVGSNFDDVFIGGSGSDRFQGGAGSDIMTGGTGADTFAWSKSDVFTTSGAPNGLDHVTDFSVTADHLDVSALLAGRSYANVGDVLNARDTNAGTVLSVKNGTGNDFTDFAVLDGVHGISTATLATADWLLT